MYLTFQEYTAMGGALTSAAFSHAEFMAEKQIDHYTFGRLKSLTTQTDTVKNLMYELVNISVINTETLNKQSETIGSYSVSFETSADKQNAIYSLICMYLSGEKLEDGTPYLYRGC